VQNKEDLENVISNCDDDGETSAGSRMLFLMKVRFGFTIVVAFYVYFIDSQCQECNCCSF
jgi:hypothetical protein